MKRLPVMTIVIALCCILCGCSDTSDAENTVAEADAAATAENAIAVVADSATAQYFTDDAVADADIEQILLAGINTPSSMNSQPWHFTAVTDASILQQIADDMSAGMPFGGPEETPDVDSSDGDAETAPEQASTTAPTKADIADAPLAIVISCTESNELDAGLACQSMAIEAQLLGYGTKIVSSPTIALNGTKQAEYKELLGIPESQAVITVLLVGVEDTSVDETADGYTAATERNPFDEMVTYVKPE